MFSNIATVPTRSRVPKAMPGTSVKITINAQIDKNNENKNTTSPIVILPHNNITRSPITQDVYFFFFRFGNLGKCTWGKRIFSANLAASARASFAQRRILARKLYSYKKNNAPAPINGKT